MKYETYIYTHAKYDVHIDASVHHKYLDLLFSATFKSLMKRCYNEVKKWRIS